MSECLCAGLLLMRSRSYIGQCAMTSEGGTAVKVLFDGGLAHLLSKAHLRCWSYYTSLFSRCHMMADCAPHRGVWVDASVGLALLLYVFAQFSFKSWAPYA
jgi:hypothetical protein